MTDLSHLDALLSRLTRELGRLEVAKTEGERAFRQREIDSCKKEIDAEYKFLGIAQLTMEEILMSDDELLAALTA